MIQHECEAIWASAKRGKTCASYDGIWFVLGSWSKINYGTLSPCAIVHRSGIFFHCVLGRVAIFTLFYFIYPCHTLVTLSSQHKQRNLVWTKGTDALEGELQSSSEVDFYIDQVKHHDCKCRYLSQPVHTTPEELANAALFLRLCLPSTGILFRHDIGAFRKPEEFEFEFYCFK